MLLKVIMKAAYMKAAIRCKRIFFLKKSIISIVLSILLIVISACEAKDETASETDVSTTATSETTETAIPTTIPDPTQTATQAAAPTTEPEATVETLIFVGEAVCTANEHVNIRAEATTDSEIIGTFPADETAGVIEYLDNWAYISYGGLTGYVSRNYLIKQPFAGCISAPQATGH